MAEKYPNHLKSIPLSITSLKHYFDVHDQPFVRSAIYLAILALIVTVVGLAVGVVSLYREETRQAAALEPKLAGLRAEGGKLTADAEQPCVLWQDLRTITVPVPDKDGKPAQEERSYKRMVVVLDTTGTVKDLEAAAEFAGCAEPARYLFFGTEQIESIVVPKARGERAQPEAIAYSDDKKLAELKTLLEQAGAAMPAITVKDGVATFDLPPGKVHLLARTRALMVMVDTSGEKRDMNAAVRDAFNHDAEFRAKVDRPEFLLFLRADAVELRPTFGQASTAWAFGQEEAVTPAALARWTAAAARSARVNAALRQALPSFLYALVILFVAALLCSVPGLIVSGVMRAGLAYGELLTIAVYAITPALAGFLIAVTVLQGEGGPWVLGAALIAGMVFSALATHRTARKLDEGGQPTI